MMPGVEDVDDKATESAGSQSGRSNSARMKLILPKLKRKPK
jgi:hypothetical protein